MRGLAERALQSYISLRTSCNLSRYDRCIIIRFGLYGNLSRVFSPVRFEINTKGNGKLVSVAERSKKKKKKKPGLQR